MSFIDTPNLPKNDVTDVLVSGEISPKSELALLNMGISVHKTRECFALYDAVKYHPDMTFHHLKGKYVLSEPTQTEYYKSQFSTLNICSGCKISGKYPCDIRYNAARVGNYIILNKRYTDNRIIDFAEKEGLEIIDVKQGYSKCNVCVIAENAIITSDAGIKSALGKFSLDVLLVDDDSVLLKNYKHGFFGGATGKIAPEKLLVNGNINFHKYANEIIAFANKYNVDIISLCDEKIEDIGSIIPIFE